MIDVKVTTTFSPEKIARNIQFGTVRGLTQTAKEGQTAVIGALKGAFTLRGNWFQPFSKYGIRITPATMASMQAEIYSAADWLAKQEKGGEVFPYKGGTYLAIPTGNVRRSKSQIIQRAQRPKNLKDAFVINSKNGAKLLVQKHGRGRKKQIVVLYVLVPKIKVKEQHVFYDPIEKVVKRRLAENVEKYIQLALNDMKP